MAKKIKLPLEMANNVAVRTLEELKENWDLEKIVGYYHNRRLVTWLSDRYYEKQAKQVAELQNVSAPVELQRQLCMIFEMPFNETNAVDVDVVIDRDAQLVKLRRITADDKVLKNIDKVAFNQEELSNLLDEGQDTIYLVNNTFTLPLSVKNKQYIGVGDVVAVINSTVPVDFKALNISLKNIKFNKEYEIITEILTELDKAVKVYLAGKFKEAFTMFLDLAAKGNGRAMYFLGEYYRQNYGGIFRDSEINTQIGYTWHKLGASNGDALAALKVAYSYPKDSLDRQNIFKKCFDAVKTLSDSGDIVAQSEIAELYRDGHGTEKNIDKRIEYLKKSAEAGCDWRWCDLASKYRNGLGVKKNAAKAKEYYQKAYEMDGEAKGEAANQLGHIFYNDKNYAEANKWYRKAGEAGFDWGWRNLANNYRDGLGVAKDTAKAKEYYQKAYGMGREAKKTRQKA